MDAKLRRNTRQRQTILDELRLSRSHPTAGEIFQSVRGRLPRISLGTVYRNLEVLAESGQVIRIYDSGQETRFDGNPLPHAHIFCDSCERLADLEIELPAFAGMTGTEVDGFLITGHSVTMRGICAGCRKRLA